MADANHSVYIVLDGTGGQGKGAIIEVTHDRATALATVKNKGGNATVEHWTVRAATGRPSEKLSATGTVLSN